MAYTMSPTSTILDDQPSSDPAARWTPLVAEAKRLRLEAGLNLVELGGYHESTWSRFERADPPSTVTLEKVTYLAVELNAPELIELYWETHHLQPDPPPTAARQSLENGEASTDYTTIERSTRAEINGAQATTHDHRRIRSNVNGLTDYWYTMRMPLHDGQPPHVAASPSAGCAELEPLDRVNNQYYRWHLGLNRPVGKGEEYEYDVTITSSNRAPSFVYTPMTLNSFDFVLRLIFKRAPKVVYEIDGKSPPAIADFQGLAKLGVPTVELEPDGSLFRRFSNVESGRSYGFVWAD